MISSRLDGCLRAALAVAAAGCSSPAPIAADASFPDAHVEVDAGPTIAISGAVAGTDGAPIAGAEVCALDDSGPACTTTGDGGSFRIAGLAAHPGIALRLEHPGHAGLLVPIAIDDRDATADATMLTDAEATALTTAVAARHPHPSLQRGIVLASVIDDAGEPVLGALVGIDDVEGSGPFYTRDLVPDASLIETQRGPVLFVSLTPGEHVLTFSHRTRACGERVLLWPTPASHQGRIPVLAGHVTWATMRCAPEP